MSGMVEIGAWDQVYATLEPTGVSLVGVYLPLVLQGQHLEVSVSVPSLGFTYMLRPHCQFRGVAFGL